MSTIKQQQEVNLVKHSIGTLNSDKKYDGEQNLDQFLHEEKKDDYCKPWARLNKMQKMNKLNEYAGEYKNKHNLTDACMKELKIYLRKALDMRKITKKSDITYDSEKGVITQIPNLQHTKSSPRGKTTRFTIKSPNTSGKSSTLKNLGIVKRKRKQKTKIDKNKELESNS
jgi:hypothetical protein